MCGELLMGLPYRQLLLACLEGERVFVYTKLPPPGAPLGQPHGAH
jgi:hypothetical protein